MKMFLLSENEDTLTGLRLAGVEGALIKSDSDFDKYSQYVLESDEIAILLITPDLARKYSRQVLEMRKDSRTLITEIPDINNRLSGGSSIARYVKDTVGVTVSQDTDSVK